jgi:protein phosphatase
MQTLSRLARSGNGFVVPTRYEVVATREKSSWSNVLQWWEELSADFSEGFVVKPLPFVPLGRRGLSQPALKCRSREHLRLVYGPQYDTKEGHEALICRDALQRCRSKHRRILRQFALSMEAVNRFVQRSPLNAVHECVLGVLAEEVAPTMES